MKPISFATLSVLASVLVAAPAAAIPITAGTAELVTYRDCTVSGASGCDVISRIITQAYGGTPGSFASSAAIDVPGAGSATGSVALSGVVGAPVLRAGSSSAAGKRLNTNSVALQRYTYTGSAPTTRTFGGALTYSQIVTGTFPGGIGGGVNAILDLFTLPTDTVEAGSTPKDNFSALFDNVTSLPGFTSIGFDHFNDDASNPSGVGTLAATVLLNPGDTIWVRALLQTPAPNGSIVDATHTFITGWDSSVDLVPGAVVAEPNAVALLGIAFAGLALARRRLRAAAIVGPGIRRRDDSAMA